MADNGGRPIAIVDDDPAVLDSLKFLLEVSGYSVVVYASAAAFIDDRATPSGCIIVDQHMPQVTGLELVGRLRRDGVNLPILLITGSPSPDILASAARFGIEVLEKPLNEDELLKFVGGHA